MKFKNFFRHGITNDENGFTLIEALIAIAIFAIGFMAVGAMQIHSMNKTTTARRATEATAAMEAQAEILRALPFYDADQNLDSDSSTPPAFDMLHDFDEGATHSDDIAGPYTVYWTVDKTKPLPGYTNILVTGATIPNSMAIRVWVTLDGSTKRLAEMEFSKFCGNPTS